MTEACDNWIEAFANERDETEEEAMNGTRRKIERESIKRLRDENAELRQQLAEADNAKMAALAKQRKTLCEESDALAKQLESIQEAAKEEIERVSKDADELRQLLEEAKAVIDSLHSGIITIAAECARGTRMPSTDPSDYLTRPTKESLVAAGIAQRQACMWAVRLRDLVGNKAAEAARTKGGA